MTPERVTRALKLWRTFVEAPKGLDIEAVDALLLRDELEKEVVDEAVLQDVRRLDEMLKSGAGRTVADLREIGVLPKIERLRTRRGLIGWWWWLDRPDEPIVLSSSLEGVPRGRAEARSSGTRDLNIAA